VSRQKNEEEFGTIEISNNKIVFLKKKL